MEMRSGCENKEMLRKALRHCVKASLEEGVTCEGCPLENACGAVFVGMPDALMHDIAEFLDVKFAMPNALYSRLMRYLSDDGSVKAKELLGWLKRLKKESEKDE